MKGRNKPKKRFTFNDFFFYAVFVAIGVALGWLLLVFVIEGSPIEDAIDTFIESFVISNYDNGYAETEHEDAVYATLDAEIIIGADSKGWHDIAITQIDYLVYLEQNIWDDLSIASKLDVLQVVVNTESTFLGFSTSVKVRAVPLDEGTKGNYSNSRKIISININRIGEETAESIVSTVLHEVKHAYQYECVAALESVPEHSGLRIFDEARMYSEGFTNYPHNRDRNDPAQQEAYVNNIIEVTAREYGENYVRYFELIGVAG